MSILVQVPLDDAPDDGAPPSYLVVEADSSDVADVVLASPDPGKVAATAAQSLERSLESLNPVLRAIKEKLAEATPHTFEVQFGVKFGGETGIILAKGTAEVNLTIKMTWSNGTSST